MILPMACDECMNEAIKTLNKGEPVVGFCDHNNMLVTATVTDKGEFSQWCLSGPMTRDEACRLLGKATLEPDE